MTVGRHEMKQVSGLGDQIIVVRCTQRDFIGVAEHRIIGSDALHLSVHTIKGKVGELHSVWDPVGDGVAPHRPNDYARAERIYGASPYRIANELHVTFNVIMTMQEILENEPWRFRIVISY